MDWQVFIGPVIGAAVAVVIYLKNRKPKRLQYEIATDQPVLTESRHARWADLSVRLGDKELRHPRVVTVRIANTGKVEAKADDFEKLFRVRSQGRDEIAAAAIVFKAKDEDEPRQLEPEEFSAATVAAPKTLLNPGDWLEYRLLLDGDTGPVRVTAHVAGFSFKPGQAFRRRLRFMEFEYGTIVAVIVGLVSVFVFFVVALIQFQVVGGNGNVQIPNTVNKALQPAISQLDQADLVVGTVNRVRNPAPSGTVIAQSPVAGKRAPKNTVVTLVVSDGP